MACKHAYLAEKSVNDIKNPLLSIYGRYNVPIDRIAYSELPINEEAKRLVKDCDDCKAAFSAELEKRVKEFSRMCLDGEKIIKIALEAKKRSGKAYPIIDPEGVAHLDKCFRCKNEVDLILSSI